MTTNRRHAYIALLLYVLIAGASLPITKPALEHISPIQLLFLRYLIASPIMLPILWLTRPKELNIKHVPSLVSLEFIQVVLQLTLLYQGLKLATSAEASLIGSTAPIMATIIGVFILKEKEEVHEWEGLGLSVIGTLIVLLAPIYMAINSISFSPSGNLLIMISYFIWAIYITLGKKHFHHINPLFISAVAALIGLLFYGLLNIHNLSQTIVITLSQPSVLIAVLFSGLLAVPLTTSLYLYGLDKIEASEAAIFTYLTPLVYIPLSILWLGESILPIQIIGLFVITVGVAIAEYRPHTNRIYQLFQRHHS